MGASAPQDTSDQAATVAPLQKPPSITEAATSSVYRLWQTIVHLLDVGYETELLRVLPTLSNEYLTAFRCPFHRSIAHNAAHKNMTGVAKVLLARVPHLFDEPWLGYLPVESIAAKAGSDKFLRWYRNAAKDGTSTTASDVPLIPLAMVRSVPETPVRVKELLLEAAGGTYWGLLKPAVGNARAFQRVLDTFQTSSDALLTLEGDEKRCVVDQLLDMNAAQTVLEHAIRRVTDANALARFWVAAATNEHKAAIHRRLCQLVDMQNAIPAFARRHRVSNQN